MNLCGDTKVSFKRTYENFDRVNAEKEYIV